ncbi:protein tyrosine phosphatase [Heterostelium album PN500]|uniref:Phosphatidylinositol 3,4,5-trisphosphate 3-phosphatase and dual-specificity protein phosphatase PTEN n=1 Tax=Heterostelium pallidum (strain ATCC 26659 / Pp 5 / PN500) TaxID=670386 RepID=D3B716_HETP5|nr:protein tyrosine phosphatase [Heterostelium album PN500]EFA82559.1 protein tyrosine phosphatase [Heterostelium album PN500]|eukprot:XP_020434676.1 protein tyrosine phosphatase [Heterostelium album PN500]
MGFPSEKVEGVFRNPMKEVQRFLDHYHKDHYRVYNLCSERDYDHSKFYGRVGCYPFDDHNAPEFALINDFCKDVDEWMKQDPKNIAVIHCKAGKGRTGLMICCWLLYCGMWKNTEESLKFYAALRTYNQKGVTIPSQIRYVHYFGKHLVQKFEFPRPQVLRKIVLKPLPFEVNLSEINLNICVGKNPVFNSKDDFLNVTIHRVDKKKKKKMAAAKKDKGSSSSSSSTAQLEAGKSSPTLSSSQSRSNSTVGKSGGSTVKLDHTVSQSTISNFDYQTYNQNQILAGKKEENEGDTDEYIGFEIGKIEVSGDVRIEVCEKDERLFMFWINTAFTNAHEVVTKPGLDKAHKDKKHKAYPEDFRVELFFDEPEHSDTTTVVATNDNVNVVLPQTKPIISSNNNNNNNNTNNNNTPISKDESDSDSDSSSESSDHSNGHIISEQSNGTNTTQTQIEP